MTRVSVSTFSGVGSLPVFAAVHLGFFEATGLAVELEPTRNSRALMSGLVDGTFDVVHAAPDNVVAWSDREGADLRAWIGGSAGPLALTAAPEFGGVSELAGKTIAVDAVTSGFVGVLREIMRASEVADDAYELREVGATGARYEALAAREVDATLLSIPMWFRAEASGLSILATHEAILSRYQSFAGSSRGDWLDDQPDTADAYLRAIISTLTWLYDPRNRPDVLALAADEFSLSPDEAGRATNVILDPVRGWGPSGMIDLEAVANVCRIRSETAGPPHHGAEHYVDLRPFARVLDFGDDDD